MTSYLYYPGCSMSSSAHAYAASVAAIAGPLGIDLDEIDDWNCCGATEYISLGPLQAHALVARNLALAERQKNGSDMLVAPCSACFVNLARTDRYVRDDPRLSVQVNEALAMAGLSYTPGAVRVRHLAEVIIDEIGIPEVARHVTRPLHGLRVAPYLGCLVTRPDYDGRWKKRQREHPRDFDRLLGALGADIVDFPLRTDCCGGHMTQISRETGFELIRRLVDGAARRHADLLATVCPMCQMNIDAYQGGMNRHFRTSYHMPILFFTQLMGLAFGAPAAQLGIGTELVSARDALARIGIETPEPSAQGEDEAPDEGAVAAPAGAAAARAHPKRSKQPHGLPMPRMPHDVDEP